MKKSVNADALRAERRKWEEREPDPSVLDRDELADYVRKKTALDMYVDDVPGTEITARTGIKPSMVRYLVKRACMPHPDLHGETMGYAALFKFRRVAKGQSDWNGRETFETLCKRYPGLEEFVDRMWFGEGKEAERCISIVNLHKAYLRYLKEECGLDDGQYPFNTGTKGMESLRRHVAKIKSEQVARGAKRLYQDQAQILLSTGVNKTRSYRAVTPYGQVQVDGHRIDCLYVLRVEHVDHTVTWEIAERPWVFAVIDVGTRAVLGRWVSQTENYSTLEVLKAIRHAIEPKERREFTFPSLRAPENGGWPDTAIPDLKWSIPEQIMLDNAKSHLSKQTRYKCENVLGCVMNYGSVATPETRAIVERFFGTFENMGFHRLPGTVGNGPKDPRRRQAEEEARRYHVTLETIEEVVDWAIMNYNNSPHDGLNGATPLQALKARMMEGMIPCKAESERMRDAVRKLPTIYEEHRLAGSERNGRRPYLQFLKARYHGNVISLGYAYAGMKVIVEIDPDDILTLNLYSPETGERIDTVECTGEWGKRHHSLQVRKWANKFENRRKREALEAACSGNGPEDPIMDLRSDLAARASRSKKARTMLDVMDKSTSPAPARSEIGIETVTSASVEAVQEPAIEADSVGSAPAGEAECERLIGEIGMREFRRLYPEEALSFAMPKIREYGMARFKELYPDK